MALEEDDPLRQLQELLDSGQITPEQAQQLAAQAQPSPTALQPDEIPIPAVVPPEPPPQKPYSLDELESLAPKPQPQEELQNLIPPELQQEIPLDPELIAAPPIKEPLPEKIPLPERTISKPPQEPLSPAQQILANLSKAAIAGREATEPQRQMVAKPAATVAALPWMVGAGAAAIKSLASIDEAEAERTAMLASWLQTQGIGAYQGVHSLLGAKVEPETPVEYAAGVGAGSFVPGGKIPTALIAGTQFITDYLAKKNMGEKPKMDLDLATSLLTTPAEAAAQPKAAPRIPKPPPGEEVSGMDLEPPGILQKPRYPVPRQNDKPGDFERRVEQYQKDKSDWLKQFNPTAQHIINTVGGYRMTKDSDLVAMGIMAAGTIGMLGLPWIAKTMYNAAVPRPLTAPEVNFHRVSPLLPESVVTNISPWDFTRAVGDDVNQATVRIATKSLAPPEDIQHLSDLIRMQGYGQAANLIDNAINLGSFQGNTLRFETPTSLKDLGTIVANTPQAKPYLIVRDILEQINIKEQQAKTAGNQATKDLAADFERVGNVEGTYAKTFSASEDPDIRINGLTFDEAREMQHTMELINPDLIKIGEMWDRWHADRRAFMADGEAATLRTHHRNEDRPEVRDRSLAYLNDQMPSEVPFAGKRSEGMSFEDRVNHTDILDALEKRSRADFRERMNNEINLHTVDTLKGLLGNEHTYFQSVTPEQLAQHPEWAPYTVTVYRRGNPEHYLTSQTMVDFMNRDPYVIPNGPLQWMNAAKRVLEFNYTGQGNPVFAFTNALRVWHGAKSMNLNGHEPPTIIGMSKSVLDQLYPQFARYIAEELNQGTGMRAAQFFGKFAGMNPAQAEAAMQGLSRRLAAAFDDSLFHAIEQRGGVHGSTLTQQLRNAKEEQILREAQLREAESRIAKLGGGIATIWRGWKAIVSAGHEAPMFDFVSANRGTAPLIDLIAEGRNLGGDPKIGGQYWFVDRETGKAHALRYESQNKFEAALIAGARAYGAGMEFGRVAAPYANAITQSVKRVGAAYLADPVGFTARTYLYTTGPAMYQYIWAQAAGTDPDGLKYTDYMMNYRPIYKQLTSWYFPIPGRRAADGIELQAIALENGLFKMAGEITMDHMFGQHKFDASKDMWIAFKNAAEVSLGIPMLPAIALWEASQGRTPGLNLLGESIKRSRDPYDQFVGMPESIERYVRVFGGGIGSMFGAAVAAYSHTEDGFANALKNAASEAAKTQLRKVPFLPNVVDIGPKIAGTNKITEEYFSKQKTIDQLIRFYQKSDAGAGIINTKAASEQGGYLADIQTGPAIQPITPGPPQPKPTNPLYNDFMADLYNRFKRDNPGYSRDGQDLGGIGFVSILRRYGDSTRALRTLEHVDDGLHVTWQKWLNQEQNKPLVEDLQKHNIDTANVRQVRNYYERKRQEVALTLLYYVRAVENEFTQRAKIKGYDGPPITLDMIEPYKTGTVNSYIYGNPLISGEAPFSIPEAFIQNYPASEGFTPLQ